MKLYIKLTAFIFSSLVFSFASCKKEASSDNRAPVANAGRDTIITLPANSIALVGKDSYDPDYGDKIISYKWTKISGPDTFAIGNENAPTSIVKDLVKGIYFFELSVTDNEGLVSKDTVGVRVIAGPKQEPLIVFENLAWTDNSIEKFMYMQTASMPDGYSVDSVLSVSIYVLDFDLLAYTWKKIERGGSDPGRFCYKIDGNTIIVYVYYTAPNGFIGIFVGNKIKVVFK
jgi:hypothetical protein